MSSYNFDSPPEREGTHTFKWDNMRHLFGRNDLLPLWVADMDFPSPPRISEAIVDRARHGIFGYTYVPDSAYDAVCEWFRDNHGWEIEPHWIGFGTGVMGSISLAIEEFTDPGDPVLIQTPVYHPFFSVVEHNRRTLLTNPLVRDENGRYTVDFDDFELQLRAGARLFVLCSPHNPVGRVWAEEELRRMVELCGRYGCRIISDEIHCDLVFPGNRHIPLADLPGEGGRDSIVCIAPTKSFNIPGLTVSATVIPDDKLRRRFTRSLRRHHLSIMNLMSILALETAYREGRDWLDEVLGYIEGNIDWFLEAVGGRLQPLWAWKPEGTYLIWIDCGRLPVDHDEFARILRDEVLLGLNDGKSFGPNGEGFQRLNPACPRSTLEEAVRRLERAVEIAMRG
jgi:cystathionine beta-lyase